MHDSRRSRGFDKLPSIGQNGTPMNVVFALLADAANVSQEGKLNILGNFAQLNASTYPARHPEMQLVVRLEASPAETGGQKKLEIRAIDEDGNVVGSGLEAEIVVPAAPSPGERIQMQLMIRMVDVTFTKAGRYVFAILIDGRTEAEVPLKVGG